jgi:hypothetical protein
MKGSEDLVVIFAILSIIGCLCIVGIYHLNSEIKKKRVNGIVCAIAICNLFAAAGVCIGEPHDGSALCWIQSFTTSYFPLVSVFLTTMIAHLLYQLVYHKQFFNTFPKVVYYGCWGLPFILTLLPLSTNSYGNPGSDKGWCFLDYRSESPRWTLLFWIIVSFYVWFYVAVVTYLLLLWFISYRISYIYSTHARARNGSEHSGRARIYRSLLRMIWYPIIIIICWLPSAIWDVEEALHDSRKGSDALQMGNMAFINVFPASQGLLTSIAFICTNKDVKSMLFGISEPLLEDRLPADGVNTAISPFQTKQLDILAPVSSSDMSASVSQDIGAPVSAPHHSSSSSASITSPTSGHDWAKRLREDYPSADSCTGEDSEEDIV